MAVAVSNSLPAFGFLTVVEDDEHGYFGGYLVLSELGRPLEFHCSTPIFPSQAPKNSLWQHFAILPVRRTNRAGACRKGEAAGAGSAD